MSKIELLSLKDGIGRVLLTIGDEQFEQDIFLPENDDYKAKQIMNQYLEDYQVAYLTLPPAKEHALIGADLSRDSFSIRVKDVAQALKRLF